MPPVRAPSPTTATTKRPSALGVARALEAQRRGDAVGVAERRRGVRVLDPVVLGLGPRGVAGQPAFLLELREALTAAGHELVDVGLVTGVEEEDVLGRVEDPVQGEGELDDAEVRAEMPAGLARRRPR